jgi:DNA-binding transcriptional ArsR family regulator
MIGGMAPIALDVLHEPHRRAVLDLLRQRPHLVGELSEVLGLSQTATSKHLRVLRHAGLVSVEVDGPRRRYHLRPEPLADLDAWLAPYRWMWSDRLDALGTHLGAMGEPLETPR